jgi:hypothetical protein
MTFPQVIFGLGPSGVGKSHILELLAPKIGFFLPDLDTKRPFSRNALRDEWHVFRTELNSGPLVNALHNRISTEKTAGIILSFPSTRILTPEQSAATRAEGHTNDLLWGSADLCREAAVGRGDRRVETEA